MENSNIQKPKGGSGGRVNSKVRFAHAMGPLVITYIIDGESRSDFFTSSFSLDSPVTYFLSTLSYCTNTDVGPE